LGASRRPAGNKVGTAAATLQIDEGLTLEAHEGRLRQLLENLFRNAIEHGGRDVTVRVGSLLDGFYVEDDGPGIPEGERDQVFGTSYSTRDEGTGLWLSVVETVVDAHGWSVTLAVGPDGDARFEFNGGSTRETASTSEDDPSENEAH